MGIWIDLGAYLQVISLGEVGVWVSSKVLPGIHHGSLLNSLYKYLLTYVGTYLPLDRVCTLFSALRVGGDISNVREDVPN